MIQVVNCYNNNGNVPVPILPLPEFEEELIHSYPKIDCFQQTTINHQKEKIKHEDNVNEFV